MDVTPIVPGFESGMNYQCPACGDYGCNWSCVGYRPYAEVKAMHESGDHSNCWNGGVCLASISLDTTAVEVIRGLSSGTAS